MENETIETPIENTETTPVVEEGLDLDSAINAALKENEGDVPPEEVAKEEPVKEEPIIEVALPNSLPKVLQDKFKAVDPDLRDWIAKREDDNRRLANDFGNYRRDMSAIARENEDILQGTPPEQAIKSYMGFERAMNNDFIGTVIEIAKSLPNAKGSQQFLDFINGNQPVQEQPPQQGNANEQRLMQEINSLKEQLEGVASFQNQQITAKTQAQFASFSDWVDGEAKETMPHLDVVIDEIQDIIDVLSRDQRTAHLDPKDMLKEAYNRAIWQNETTRDNLIAERAEKALKEKQLSTQKAREMSGIKSTNRGAVAPQGLNLEDALDLALQQQS
jgi:hypothetical protein